ncbi:MAG: glycosyltransferase family 4 protein [Planctomycetes bacterium]|nr:glycosyltransferase family 4 protein [Planctomycetota bacterium]
MATNSLIHKRTKVVHVITRLIKGGAQKICLDIVEKLPKDKYEVCLVSGVSTGQEGSFWSRVRLIKDIHLEVIPELTREVSPIKDFLSLVKLYHFFRLRHPDIVHCHTSKAGFVGCLAAKLAGVKVIIYLPQGHLFAEGARIPGVSGNILRLKLFYYLRKLASACATKIIALNYADKDEQVKLKLAPAGKYEVIYNAVEIASPALSEKERGRNDKSAGFPVLATIGRLVPEKGQSYLMEAVKLVKTKYPDVSLLVIGDGPLRDNLETQADKSGIKNSVKFLGVRDDLYSILSCIDIFVLPSLYEAFGIVLLEAMASAKPVIASRVNGIPEVVVDGKTGLLVPPANPSALSDAIIKLAADKTLAQKMGAAGYERVKDLFTIEQMIGKIDNLYGRLVNRRDHAMPDSHATSYRHGVTASRGTWRGAEDTE